MIDRLLDTFLNTFWFLSYSLNGAAFQQVSGSSSVIRATFSDHYTDGIDCTQQLGSGTFISDNNGMTEGTGQSSAQVVFTDGPEEAEGEWCLEIVGDDVNDRDSIVLRGAVLAGGLYSRGYLEAGDITVDKPVTIRRTIIIE
jgi:hypothetical protein